MIHSYTKHLVLNKKLNKKQKGRYLKNSDFIMIFLNVVRSQLKLLEIIGDHQCGFRRNRSTTDRMFCIRQILEKKWEYNEAVHQLFIDFEKDPAPWSKQLERKKSFACLPRRHPAFENFRG